MSDSTPPPDSAKRAVTTTSRDDECEVCGSFLPTAGPFEMLLRGLQDQSEADEERQVNDESVTLRYSAVRRVLEAADELERDDLAYERRKELEGKLLRIVRMLEDAPEDAISRRKLLRKAVERSANWHNANPDYHAPLGLPELVMGTFTDHFSPEDMDRFTVDVVFEAVSAVMKRAPARERYAALNRLAKQYRCGTTDKSFPVEWSRARGEDSPED